MSAIARFWSGVKTGPLDRCWEWMGPTMNAGYGRTLLVNRGKRQLTHRIAWFLANKEWPGELCVLHHCDNRLCCNPAHLFLGTRSDNAKDMVRKGRNVKGDRFWSVRFPEKRPRGDRHGMRLHPEAVPRGVRSGNAKLTELQVRELRARVRGGESYRAAGRYFGISDTTARKIALQKSWAHIVDA